MSGPTGFGPAGNPWVCPACETRIRANPGGTRVVRTEVTSYLLYDDGTASAAPGAKAQVQYYHKPCWEAAIKRFNDEQAGAFHT